MSKPGSAHRTSTGRRTWRIGPGEAGQRLATFLRLRLGPDAGLAAVKRSLERGRCTVNGRIRTFGSYRLKAGDRVVFSGRLIEKRPPLTIRERCVLFRDDYLLIYDKPAGYPCAPTDDPARPSLLSALEAHSGAGGLVLVHRLDRDTSGAMLFARDQDTARAVEGLFRRRAVRKLYEAIVDGVLRREEGQVVSNLKKAGGTPGRWASVREGGRRAETAWRVLERLGRATLLGLEPRTGRTHQLRVHLSEMGHPILGDALYGRKFRCDLRPERHLLHARRIEFEHPVSGRKVSATAPRPADFKRALARLAKREA